MNSYDFDEQKVFDVAVADWNAFSTAVGSRRIVIGISGGKDSTCEAFLAAKLVGKENVYGVMMPNGEQKDIADSEQVIAESGINRLEINIGKACEELEDALFCNDGLRLSNDAKINLPPRLRMSALYAVAQTVGGIVFCADNLCEKYLGYSTLWGDSVGSYAPIQNLTVPEVISFGKWLGAPAKLMEKKPGDGLQALGDEERMGITYKAVHDLVRTGTCEEKYRNAIVQRYVKNRFKLEMISIRGPEFGFPDCFKNGQLAI